MAGVEHRQLGAGDHLRDPAARRAAGSPGPAGPRSRASAPRSSRASRAGRAPARRSSATARSPPAARVAGASSRRRCRGRGGRRPCAPACSGPRTRGRSRRRNPAAPSARRRPGRGAGRPAKPPLSTGRARGRARGGGSRAVAAEKPPTELPTTTAPPGASCSTSCSATSAKRIAVAGLRRPAGEAPCAGPVEAIEREPVGQQRAQLVVVVVVVRAAREQHERPGVARPALVVRDLAGGCAEASSWRRRYHMTDRSVMLSDRPVMYGPRRERGLRPDRRIARATRCSTPVSRVAEEHGLAGLSVNRVVAAGGRREGHLLRPLRRTARRSSTRSTRASTSACRTRSADADRRRAAGGEQIVRAAEAYLDVCLSDRAVKALALEARSEGAYTSEMRRRVDRFAAAAVPSFKAMGWPDASAAAQLVAAMTGEIAIRELEAGRRLPAVAARAAALRRRLRRCPTGRRTGPCGSASSPSPVGGLSVTRSVTRADLPRSPRRRLAATAIRKLTLPAFAPDRVNLPRLRVFEPTFASASTSRCRRPRCRSCR